MLKAPDRDLSLEDVLDGTLELKTKLRDEEEQRNRQWVMRQILALELQGKTRADIAKALNYSGPYIVQLMKTEEYEQLREPYLELERSNNEAWVRRLDKLASDCLDEIAEMIESRLDPSPARLELLMKVIRMAGKGEITRSQGKMQVDHTGVINVDVITDMTQDFLRIKKIEDGQVIETKPLLPN